MRSASEVNVRRIEIWQSKIISYNQFLNAIAAREESTLCKMASCYYLIRSNIFHFGRVCLCLFSSSSFFRSMYKFVCIYACISSVASDISRQITHPCHCREKEHIAHHRAITNQMKMCGEVAVCKQQTRNGTDVL